MGEYFEKEPWEDENVEDFLTEEEMELLMIAWGYEKDELSNILEFETEETPPEDHIEDDFFNPFYKFLNNGSEND